MSAFICDIVTDECMISLLVFLLWAFDLRPPFSVTIFCPLSDHRIHAFGLVVLVLAFDASFSAFLSSLVRRGSGWAWRGVRCVLKLVGNIIRQFVVPNLSKYYVDIFRQRATIKTQRIESSDERNSRDFTPNRDREAHTQAYTPWSWSSELTISCGIFQTTTCSGDVLTFICLARGMRVCVFECVCVCVLIWTA